MLPFNIPLSINLVKLLVASSPALIVAVCAAVAVPVPTAVDAAEPAAAAL